MPLEISWYTPLGRTLKESQMVGNDDQMMKKRSTFMVNYLLTCNQPARLILGALKSRDDANESLYGFSRWHTTEVKRIQFRPARIYIFNVGNKTVDVLKILNTYGHLAVESIQPEMRRPTLSIDSRKQRSLFSRFSGNCILTIIPGNLNSYQNRNQRPDRLYPSSTCLPGLESAHEESGHCENSNHSRSQKAVFTQSRKPHVLTFPSSPDEACYLAVGGVR